MLSNSQRSFIISLHQKKNRMAERRFLAEGSRLVLDIVQANPSSIEWLIATEKWVVTYQAKLSNFNQNIKICSESDIERMSQLKSTEHVIALVNMDALPLTDHYPDISLYLDNVQDPGNLGTILRTADWFGIPKIFASLTTVELTNAKTVQASMASFMRVELSYCSFDGLVPHYTKRYAATSRGNSIFEQTIISPALIVIGNEAHGVTDEVLSQCTDQIAIPAHMSLGAESLNAAVAASILVVWAKNK